MEIRHQQSPREVAGMDTAALRRHFLVQGITGKDTLEWVYTHYDRVMVGGIRPGTSQVELTAPPEIKAERFLDRRELGIINLGGRGTVVADGVTYDMERLDCLYLGMGTATVRFSSVSAAEPARFFLMSAPAHHAYPNTLMRQAESTPTPMGDMLTSNKRVIYKYIHQDGIRSCQLVLGLTMLEPGCVWNSVPPHTHDRRMEVYFYFDVPEKERIFHFMGQPEETRHILVADGEAVISPPWSMHFGCGTSNYSFIWGMAGENQVFSDMDPVPIATIR